MRWIATAHRKNPLPVTCLRIARCEYLQAFMENRHVSGLASARNRKIRHIRFAGTLFGIREWRRVRGIVYFVGSILALACVRVSEEKKKTQVRTNLDRRLVVRVRCDRHERAM